jgi:cytochrome c biogenesis protein CcdA
MQSTAIPTTNSVPASEIPSLATQTTITVPFVGTIDLAEQSLVITTALIAFVDGFNPCSLWVLSLLLAIVIYSGSRKRIIVVGATFLAVTSLAYGAFIAGLFNVFAYVGYLGWIQVTVALMALAFALINIKDYFWFRQGVSLTISERHKSKIYQHIRHIMTSGHSTSAVIGATAVMALGITLVELPCTAGFPVVWANVIANHDISTLGFASLLGLYLAIYLLDEIVVFVSVAFTLTASRFEERHGRILKLIGGMVMLALALVLLFVPEQMNSVGGSIAIFATALAGSLIIIVVHRQVLPRFGIRIGTKVASSTQSKH